MWEWDRDRWIGTAEVLPVVDFRRSLLILLLLRRFSFGIRTAGNSAVVFCWGEGCRDDWQNSGNGKGGMAAVKIVDAVAVVLWVGAVLDFLKFYFWVKL